MHENGGKGKRKAAVGFEVRCFFSRSDAVHWRVFDLFQAELRQVCNCFGFCLGTRTHELRQGQDSRPVMLLLLLAAVERSSEEEEH